MNSLNDTTVSECLDSQTHSQRSSIELRKYLIISKARCAWWNVNENNANSDSLALLFFIPVFLNFSLINWTYSFVQLSNHHDSSAEYKIIKSCRCEPAAWGNVHWSSGWCNKKKASSEHQLCGNNHAVQLVVSRKASQNA